jgi:cell division septum initiation protein DivIVA
MSEPVGPAEGADVESMLRRVTEIVSTAKNLPLTSSVRLDNREEVLELLEDATASLPEELRQARWLLKERQEYLDSVQRQGDEILESARVRAEHMVQRTEIVREAQRTARKTVEDAREEARRLKHEAEDYCDQKLAAFEIVLERTLKTVNAGRQKLAAVPLGLANGQVGQIGQIAGVETGDGSMSGEETFFDQDRP